MGPFLVSTDPDRLDPDSVHAYLSASYWAAGRSRETVERSLKNSLCFGLYEGKKQIGLARVITDRATYAYLCDVYVLESKRGKGLGKWLMECVLAHPEVGRLSWSLKTRDAHGLYSRSGFTPLQKPETYMERKARPG